VSKLFVCFVFWEIKLIKAIKIVFFISDEEEQIKENEAETK